MQALAEELTHAQTLAEQGEAKAALKKLDGVRRAALAAEDIPALEQVLQLARTIREQTDGNRRYEAGNVAYSARENIRFVGRKQALAEGKEWIDPFEGFAPLAATRAIASPSGESWLAQWPWAPWAFAAWLLAIVGTAAALGTISTAPGEELDPATFVSQAALSGLTFGLLLGLFLPGPLWRGWRWLVPMAAGSGMYGFAYTIAAAVAYGGGDEGDTGGLGQAFIFLTIVCVGPMVAAAAVGGLIHAVAAASWRRWRP